MIEQGNRTQQLIYRTSYRKHRERLAGIKHNITTTDFLPPRQAQSGKKSQHKDRVRKEEIEANNHYLKNKISAIKNRNHSKLEELYSTEQVRKEPKRYFDDGTQVKIQVTSELNNEGQHYKFVLPSGKTPSNSQNVKSKDARIEANLASKGNSIEKCYKKYTSNSVLKDSQKDLKSNKDKQILYNLPERNQNRVVIYKKTLIISSMQSCMLELSLINERLLIAAYMMGLENVTLRQLLPPKRSADILKEYQNNYDELCSRIVVQKVGEKYQFIRINPKEESKQKALPEEDRLKQKAKIQNDFIKRNYYTLAKSQEESKLEGQKEKSGVSFEQVQAIVERLAVPKRLYKFREERLDKIENVEKPRVVSNYQKESKNYQNSQEELPRANNRRSLEKSKESETSLTKNKDPIIRMPKKESLVKKSLPQKKKEQENEQRYEQEQQNYEQQFDNPSQLKKSPTPVVPTPKEILKQSQKISHKYESQVYDNDFQNQPEKVEPQQQQYQEQFQENNPQSPLPKKKIMPATPVDGVEQEYEQEFAD